jgi:hypothetical protein
MMNPPPPQPQPPRQEQQQFQSQESVNSRRMELASRGSPYHNFPHIIIAGQPFYLIPSNPADCAAFENSESYAYPQHCNVPIYEEIDPHQEDEVQVHHHQDMLHFANGGSEEYSSVQSDQGEAGSNPNSLERVQPKIFQPRHPRLLVNPMNPHERPPARLPHRSPAAASNSSDAPSGSTGSSSVYYYSDTLRNPGNTSDTLRNSGNTSDTMRNNPAQPTQPDDLSDSGFSNRSTSANAKRNNSNRIMASSSASSSSSSVKQQLDTRVVLKQEKSSEEDGSTLV